MAKMLPPASGTGQFCANAEKVIRFVRKGCTNRPFYHIVVAETKSNQHSPCIEQVGTYDPLPNEFNEKLVAFNYERIRHWIGNGAELSKPVEQLLGLSGFFPVHPTSIMNAWRKRQRTLEEARKAAEKPTEEKTTTEAKN